MNIYGLQKMTLLDFPGRVACTIFTGGCDLRCPFCHNYELAEGSAPPVMGEEELLSFLRKRTGLLDGAAVTGGEPCLQKELPELLKKIRDLGYAVKLDTNGFHPEMLERLLREGLVDYAAVDIKNSPAKYAATCGKEALDLAPLYETIALLTGGKTPYEFRTTAVKPFHEAADFAEIGRMIEGVERYFVQCFADRDTVPYSGLSAPSKEELKAFADAVRPYVLSAEIRGADL